MIALRKSGEWLVGVLGREDAGYPLGELLRERWKLPKKTVHLLFQHKEILLDGAAVSQTSKTEAGEEIRMRLCKPEPLGLPPLDQPLSILFEDDHVLVVDKPAGLLLHPSADGNSSEATLDHLVAGHFARQGIEAKVRHVHRLDLDTSGAVIYAKHALAAALLDELLRVRQIKRSYAAFLHGTLAKESGTITLPIGKDRHHPQRRRVTPQGEHAVTHYTVRQRYRAATRVECSLDTGRTHQIRVHFSHFGHPLIGDVLYGGRQIGIRRQALHAERVSFPHPFGGETIVAYAPWPKDMLQLETGLRK